MTKRRIRVAVELIELRCNKPAVEIYFPPWISCRQGNKTDGKIVAPRKSRSLSCYLRINAIDRTPCPAILENVTFRGGGWTRCFELASGCFTSRHRCVLQFEIDRGKRRNRSVSRGTVFSR